MPELTLRPRFHYHLHEEPTFVLAHLEQSLGEAGDKVSGQVVQHHVMIKVAAKDRHYWSPQLDLEIEPHEKIPDGSLIRGIIGPSPSVWTLFVFLYSALGFFALVGMIVSLSQWTLHKPVLGLWLLLGAGLAMGGVYAAGQAGKRLAVGQTLQLRLFLDHCLESFTPIRS